MNDPKEYLGKCYAVPDGYLRVIGYIDRPALLLQNPVTGRTETVVIGCQNHQHMQEVEPARALEIAEAALRAYKSVQ
jgi:hypothetical protein